MHVYRAAMWKQDNWFIVQCHEIDLATQGGSESEAEENMRECLALHLDVIESDIQLAIEHETDTQTNFAPETKTPKAERTFRQVRFHLESNGFRGITQKPNHAKFIRTSGDTTLTAILPHYTELSHPVITSILRQAGLPIDSLE